VVIGVTVDGTATSWASGPATVARCHSVHAVLDRAEVACTDHSGDTGGLVRAVADHIAAGQVVGWCRGKARTHLGVRAAEGAVLRADEVRSFMEAMGIARVARSATGVSIEFGPAMVDFMES
jgi:hypothetical protein